ncbi:carboxymuconolactone decarboxylase family protein [Glycomyces harbinensis]|uniref:Alkylhydroperoxidase family enzyme, contains CxxC motif n=1 Tax=Glycomyces harbinensis TaxID=58114 RepID=A0A1G6W3N1_9ACTN|nr:carboxymuconolactone decarboxylase family protein [Glycomyces harbinensis]SDD59817.1 Alkylhydroperoxidase family enzyme, contains CxxC motif [Glycomyces harbinensis]
MDTPATPARSRMPNPLPLLPGMADLAGGLHAMVEESSVPRSTVRLMELRAGQILGSTYFAVRDSANLRAAGERAERIAAVATWRTASCFTDAERVALELVEAVLSPNPIGERVPDEMHARAAAHYDDKGLWDLVMALAHIGFFTPVALIAKPIPGMPPGQNYSE